jgi:hypothetical protein
MAIFNVLKMTCIEYQIQNKIISVTTDNAWNNGSGVKIFKNWLIESNGIKQVNDFHLRHFVHVINLAVNDGILSITDSIEYEIISFVYKKFFDPNTDFKREMYWIEYKLC